ncbi:unnamed protein product, partial [Mycena citricolor]
SRGSESPEMEQKRAPTHPIGIPHALPFHAPTEIGYGEFRRCTAAISEHGGEGANVMWRSDAPQHDNCTNTPNVARVLSLGSERSMLVDVPEVRITYSGFCDTSSLTVESRKETEESLRVTRGVLL